MGKLMVLASCCFMLATAHMRPDLDTNFLSFQDSPKPGHIEAFDDNHVKKLFANLLGKSLPSSSQGYPSESQHSVVEPVGSESASAGLPEVMLLHSQLQNKLGWASDDGGSSNRNQYGPPPGGNTNAGRNQYGPPQGNLQNQYGPPNPPTNQYGPPGGNPPNQYGPPQENNVKQQYGPPQENNVKQQYGPPQENNVKQQYGPPQENNIRQQYGPPQENNVRQQYGPPQENNIRQQYGPPQENNVRQQYGPPQENNIRQQYGPPQDAVRNQYGPPPANQLQNQYGPPAENSGKNQYGPPSGNSINQYGPPGGFSQSNQGGFKQNEGYGGPPPKQEYSSPALQANSNGGYKTTGNQGNFGGYVENFKISEAVSGNSGGYSQPASKHQVHTQSSFSNNGVNDVGGLQESGSKIFKHVYIHTPPPEQEPPQQARVIRPNKKQDTHYQIIFVKAPAPPQAPLTEIELPAPPERKTLVYVLVKKPEQPAEIKFRAPQPTQPSKPEVYFIRYKGNAQPNLNAAQELLSDVGPSGEYDSRGPNEEYSSPQSPLLGHTRIADGGNILSKPRESLGYPNTEYRATPSMLNPNQEPMSIAVYDRVRNGVPGAANTGSVSSAGGTSSLRGQQGSHYTAPGSQPFDIPSGRMINGQYKGMTSSSLSDQYYAPPEEDDQRGYQ